MAKGYRIKVIGERAADIHRTRNMAEELHVEFTRHGYGTTSDPDTMTTEFEVKIKAARDIGEATALMRSILKKHHMENDVEIEKV